MAGLVLEDGPHQFGIESGPRVLHPGRGNREAGKGFSVIAVNTCAGDNKFPAAAILRHPAGPDVPLPISGEAPGVNVAQAVLRRVIGEDLPVVTTDPSQS